MKPIRTVIVDDEPVARERLMHLIGMDPDIAVVAECRNGGEALNAVLKFRPDLLFLDVQMPEANGFEVVQLIKPELMPFVVFVTAHDQYALKAFDVDAVDYLLKPYDNDRFRTSLLKAKRFIDMRNNAELTGKLVDLVRDHVLAQKEFAEEFIVKEKGHKFKVLCSDLIYLRAEGNYLYLKTKAGRHLYRMTMNAVESIMDPARFMRIHRRWMINRAFVKDVRYHGNNEFIFKMANGEEVVSGRLYKSAIAKILLDRIDP
jgi:two-component system LytT family response regulator